MEKDNYDFQDKEIHISISDIYNLQFMRNALLYSNKYVSEKRIQNTVFLNQDLIPNTNNKDQIHTHESKSPYPKNKIHHPKHWTHHPKYQIHTPKYPRKDKVHHPKHQKCHKMPIFFTKIWNLNTLANTKYAMYK